MRFRTEIESVRGSFEINHQSRVVLLGSCFADNIGAQLAADGFEAVHNPLGPLFNPASIARVIARGGRPYGPDDFVQGADGVWHCLDFAMRYQADTAEGLAVKVNADYLPLAAALDRADVLIVTLGTNKVFRYGNGAVAGNCHKLPGAFFATEYLEIDEIAELWDTLPVNAKNVIFTVSPVRYTESGLTANSLTKAKLRVATDILCRRWKADYFPAYEIVNDDLRDYRFYADDLKHPSEMAVKYIYEHFADAYFSAATKEKAAECRRATLRSLHRNLL